MAFEWARDFSTGLTLLMASGLHRYTYEKKESLIVQCYHNRVSLFSVRFCGILACLLVVTIGFASADITYDLEATQQCTALYIGYKSIQPTRILLSVPSHNGWTEYQTSVGTILHRSRFSVFFSISDN